MAIKVQSEKNSGTNCVDCERYKKLGDLCVLEHGKKFLWEYCKDFESAVQLPDYTELMKSVKQDMALERKKIREKKKKEIAQKRRARDLAKKEKLRLKRSTIAKKAWETRKKILEKNQIRKKERKAHVKRSTKGLNKNSIPLV
jgi:hypothetical protein